MEYLQKYFEGRKKEDWNSGAIAFFASLDNISKRTPAVAQSILSELEGQRKHLKLIASENYCSLAVQQAMGNLLTDKYSEGIIGRRFYAGCENVDAVETVAADLARRIFGCEHAYVQPHSGADANMVAYWAILVHRIQTPEMEKLAVKTVDELSVEEYERIRQLLVNQKVLGLSLNSGGHLTHGYRQNMSAKMMIAKNYETDPKTGIIDYAALQKQVKEERPLILVAGYSACPRLINFAKMRDIAASVGAVLMVDMAHFAGLVAGKVLQGEHNPVGYADIITTTTHKTLRGPRGGMILCTEEYREIIDKGCPLVLGGPLPNVMAAKAVAFTEANTAEFCLYAEQIVKNARALSEELLTLGAEVVTGGTDNHMLLVDVEKSFGLTGRQAEKVLMDAFMAVNRNAIFNDVNGPWYTSGVRLGTPALTTLGMKEGEMKEVARLIVRLLKYTRPKIIEKSGQPSKAAADTEVSTLMQTREEVEALLKNFPLYPELTCNGS